MANSTRVSNLKLLFESKAAAAAADAGASTSPAGFSRERSQTTWAGASSSPSPGAMTPSRPGVASGHAPAASAAQGRPRASTTLSPGGQREQRPLPTTPKKKPPAPPPAPRRSELVAATLVPSPAQTAKGAAVQRSRRRSSIRVRSQTSSRRASGIRVESGPSASRPAVRGGAAFTSRPSVLEIVQEFQQEPSTLSRQGSLSEVSALSRQPSSSSSSSSRGDSSEASARGLAVNVLVPASTQRPPVPTFRPPTLPLRQNRGDVKRPSRTTPSGRSEPSDGPAYRRQQDAQSSPRYERGGAVRNDAPHRHSGTTASGPSSYGSRDTAADTRSPRSGGALRQRDDRAYGHQHRPAESTAGGTSYGQQHRDDRQRRRPHSDDDDDDRQFMSGGFMSSAAGRDAVSSAYGTNAPCDSYIASQELIRKMTSYFAEQMRKTEEQVRREAAHDRMRLQESLNALLRQGDESRRGEVIERQDEIYIKGGDRTQLQAFRHSAFWHLEHAVYAYGAKESKLINANDHFLKTAFDVLLDPTKVLDAGTAWGQDKARSWWQRRAQGKAAQKADLLGHRPSHQTQPMLTLETLGETVIEAIAILARLCRALTFRYEAQLMRMSVSAAEELGLCAARRVFSWLLAGQARHPAWGADVPHAVTSSTDLAFGDGDLLIGALLDGVCLASSVMTGLSHRKVQFQGFDGRDQKHSEKALLCQTGIKTRSAWDRSEQYWDMRDRDPQSPEVRRDGVTFKCAAHVYGYRLGSEREARAWGLSGPYTTPDTHNDFVERARVRASARFEQPMQAVPRFDVQTSPGFGRGRPSQAQPQQEQQISGHDAYLLRQEAVNNKQIQEHHQQYQRQQQHCHQQQTQPRAWGPAPSQQSTVGHQQQALFGFGQQPGSNSASRQAWSHQHQHPQPHQRHHHQRQPQPRRAHAPPLAHQQQRQPVVVQQSWTGLWYGRPASLPQGAVRAQSSPPPPDGDDDAPQQHHYHQQPPPQQQRQQQHRHGGRAPHRDDNDNNNNNPLLDRMQNNRWGYDSGGWRR